MKHLLFSLPSFFPSFFDSVSFFLLLIQDLSGRTNRTNKFFKIFQNSQVTYFFNTNVNLCIKRLPLSLNRQCFPLIFVVY